MTAPILPPSSNTIKSACEVLRDGGLVALPTETVYGLAADAANPIAVARIYKAKGRPAFNPLIAHIDSLDMALKLGQFSKQAMKLAEAHWPGPLTLVVHIQPDCPVCDLARAGLDSIALRLPAHRAARDLLQAFNGPLVAPSANPSGQISPTRADHVATDLGNKIDLIIDGGPCEAGIESTIIDARSEGPVLLRPGALPAAEIETIWPGLGQASDHAEESPRAPGLLSRHYAPRQPLRLNAETPEPGESYLAFGTAQVRGETHNLSSKGDLVEAASNLFTMLRALDALGRPIAVAPIPAEGLGEAINDRLTRAAKPA